MGAEAEIEKEGEDDDEKGFPHGVERVISRRVRGPGPTGGDGEAAEGGSKGSEREDIEKGLIDFRG